MTIIFRQYANMYLIQHFLPRVHNLRYQRLLKLGAPMSLISLRFVCIFLIFELLISTSLIFIHLICSYLYLSNLWTSHLSTSNFYLHNLWTSHLFLISQPLPLKYLKFLYRSFLSLSPPNLSHFPLICIPHLSKPFTSHLSTSYFYFCYQPLIFAPHQYLSTFFLSYLPHLYII